MADRPISIRRFRNQMQGDVAGIKAEARADCIAELEAVLVQYRQDEPTYFCHFEDAIKVLKYGAQVLDE